MVEDGDHGSIDEHEERDPNTTIVQPEGERGGELEDRRRSLSHISVIPRRAQHGEIERDHHHASVEHRPLSAVLVDDDVLDLLCLLGIDLLRVGLVHLLAADAEGHPVSRADDEEHAENGHPVVAAALEGVALLGVSGRGRGHVAGVGEQRGRQVEERDAEEGGGGKEAAIHLLRETDAAADEAHQ